MLNRRRIRYGIMVFLVLSIVLGRSPAGRAQTGPEIVVDPDLRTIALEQREELTLTVRTDETNQVHWTLAGPGKLKGEDTAFLIVYVPPEQIPEATAQAVVTATVTNVNGEQTTVTVTFMLRAPQPTPTPEPAPTPPRLSSQDMEQLQQMEQAFLAAQAYEQPPTTPPDAKREMWAAFLQSFAADLPILTRDDELRKQAQARIIFWQAQASMTPTPTPTPKAWTEPITGMKFVWIKGGCFQMGSPDSEPGPYADEGPVHRVCVDGFYLGQYEVTQAEWKTIMGRTNNPSSFQGEDRPVEKVSWDDVQEFLRQLNNEAGKNPPLPLPGGEFRLPTEAEWEYACRAGTQTAYNFGKDAGQLDKYAWYDGNSGRKTHPVGGLRPNAWGLYDMHGNVWEWCADIYALYSDRSQSNPLVKSGGPYRVLRGGSWFSGPWGLRSALRLGSTPSSRDNYVGFRLVRTK